MTAEELQRQLAEAQETVRALREQLGEIRLPPQARAVDLERRVDDLTAELSDAHEELLKTNSDLMQLTLELDDRVAERTAELARANESLRAEVAERERAEEARRLSDERYRNLFNTIDEGFCIVELIFDAESRPVDYRFLEVNRAFEKQTGLCNAQGKRMRELAPAHEAHWFEIYGQIAVTGEPRRFENEARALNRWYDVYAYRVGDPARRQVAILFNDISEHKRAETALREMNETLERRVADRTVEVQRQADQLRALASDLTMTEQRERKRLAAILHDHIQQLLVAARLQVERLKRDGDIARRSVTARAVESILTEALDASRSLTVELCPPVLHETGLVGGLNWLASRTLENNHFVVKLNADTGAEPASEERRFLLFECARELLLNAVKHASVPEAHVTLRRTHDDRIQLSVRDEGKGFDPDLLKKRGSDETSFGLFSIQQRLAHIGGGMEIATGPGLGTSITLTVPADDEPPARQMADAAVHPGT